MIKVSREISLDEFKAWSGAVTVLDHIIELDLVSEAENYILEMFGYADDIDETALYRRKPTTLYHINYTLISWLASFAPCESFHNRSDQILKFVNC